MGEPSTKVYPLANWWLLATLMSLAGSFGLFGQFPALSWSLGFAICLASLRKCLNFPPLALIFFFNLLFFIYSLPYIFFGLDMFDLPNSTAQVYLCKALWLNALFTSAVMFASNLSLLSKPHSFAAVALRLRVPHSNAVFSALLIGIVLITFTLIKGGIVVGSDSGYSDYIDNLDANSGIAEYMLVIIFVSFLFAQGRIQRFAWRIVVLVFIVKLALIGFRVVALMASLAFLWSFNVNLRAKSLIIIFVAGFFLFSFLGIIKEGQYSIDDIFNSLLFAMHGENAVSHHINVVWASSKLILLVDQDVIDIYRRIYFFFYLMINALVPASLIIDLSGQPYLGTWLQQSGNSSGGGHISAFLFVAGGSPLVLAFGFLYGLIIKFALSNRDGQVLTFVRAFFLMSLLTFPRWVSYDIGNFLLKLPLYAALIILFFGILPRRCTI